MLKSTKQPGFASPKSCTQAGLAKLIVVIIVAVLILSYLGINIQKIAESDTGKANFAYLGGILGQIWGYLVSLYQQYLGPHIPNFWDNSAFRQVSSTLSDLIGKFKK